MIYAIWENRRIIADLSLILSCYQAAIILSFSHFLDNLPGKEKHKQKPETTYSPLLT